MGRAAIYLLLCSLLVGLRTSVDAPNSCPEHGEGRRLQRRVCKECPNRRVAIFVDAYLRPKKLEIQSRLRPNGTDEAFVEMFREESIRWYCGKGSVGLTIDFTENRLVRSSAGSWSFDCP